MARLPLISINFKVFIGFIAILFFVFVGYGPSVVVAFDDGGYFCSTSHSCKVDPDCPASTPACHVHGICCTRFPRPPPYDTAVAELHH